MGYFNLDYPHVVFRPLLLALVIISSITSLVCLSNGILKIGAGVLPRRIAYAPTVCLLFLGGIAYGALEDGLYSLLSFPVLLSTATIWRLYSDVASWIKHTLAFNFVTACGSLLQAELLQPFIMPRVRSIGY